ncbi:AraC family transcriptional regulator [Actinoplanes italicus]|uniref:AraC family transcriptional regulator n=1 Tax=Actinoplanes italicus TaxID=113567 RepID=A0A2T0K6K9_9ACTN|nr:AraC family transcriptional regulator [Actinoplanes italicus]PRX18625.1 AraC family transcriptional regulator [Actinoplanes italicus]GIE32963.1 AraC family transcriptional regulator [Actinoplanes italicus]
MSALIQHTEPTPTRLPPDWSGIIGCVLPVAAGAATGLLSVHALVLTTSGPLFAEVDFDEHVCGPGTLLWIRPGQAVRFGEPPGDTIAVVFRPGLFGPEELPGLVPDDPTGPARTPLTPSDPQVFRDALTHLAADSEGEPGAVTAALLRHQLAAVLLRIRTTEPPIDPVGQVEGRTFERFQRRLEEGYPQTRRVEDYAAELGCSVRTLTRASLALTGRTAKQVVDDRVALQARRLLAATPLSVAEVGRVLGFGEPTNFGRFFHRETGLSPGQFRARFTAGAPSGIPGQRHPSE